jgi:SagB-type dehydrogenase family enzyme
MKESAAIVVIAAVYDRTTRKYGQRGIRYVHMEVGHVAQNIYLQVASLNMATVLIGAFDDKRVKELLKLPSAEQPLGLMPIGGNQRRTWKCCLARSQTLSL